MEKKLETNFSDFLQSVPVLAEFAPQELAVLEKAMTVRDYPGGYEFIGEARRGDGMYLVIDGEVIATHRHARMRGLDVIERLGPGELFGLVALVDHRPTWATYRAAGRVTAASLPLNAFELLFTANAPIAHHFQNLIAIQLVKDLRTCARSLMTQLSRSAAEGDK